MRALPVNSDGIRVGRLKSNQLTIENIKILKTKLTLRTHPCGEEQLAATMRNKRYLDSGSQTLDDEACAGCHDKPERKLHQDFRCRVSHFSAGNGPERHQRLLVSDIR